nr:unnamed protein product [Digitaria exilis]
MVSRVPRALPLTPLPDLAAALPSLLTGVAVCEKQTLYLGARTRRRGPAHGRRTPCPPSLPLSGEVSEWQTAGCGRRRRGERAVAANGARGTRGQEGCGKRSEMGRASLISALRRRVAVEMEFHFLDG